MPPCLLFSERGTQAVLRLIADTEVPPCAVEAKGYSSQLQLFFGGLPWQTWCLWLRACCLPVPFESGLL